MPELCKSQIVVCVCVLASERSPGAPGTHPGGGPLVSTRPGDCHRCQYPVRMSAPIPTRPFTHIRYANNIAYNWRPVVQSCMSPRVRCHQQQRCVGKPTNSYWHQYPHQQQRRHDNDYVIMPTAVRFRPYYDNGAYKWH